MTYSLCEWFMQTYGDWNYQNQPFVMPSETEMSNYVVADKEQEKKFEDELTKEAEKQLYLHLRFLRKNVESNQP